ncbi:unnamed protein product [Prorocentrum cordatum]|uniref:RING-type domain-containing protein n=1 Tax=Prorocentrum cordatum TaxID=2364126 RepID=A0ABN9Q671_9DINO|nr:unnamed protein product [Polarella glacialis]
MMWSAAASLFATSPAPSPQDCAIQLQRLPQQAPGLDARVVPAAMEGGLALAWQDGESILLQRFGHDCAEEGPRSEVNSTREFFRQPAASGLHDVVGLRGGSAAVAWTLHGHVWVRLVGPYGPLGPPRRASGPGDCDRTQVRLSASSVDGSFAVVWSSWGQDGDGWGVFARLFDRMGRPVHEERQVNSEWRHFQWQPQVAWCGDSLWALWVNGTSGYCNGPRDACSTGPFVRRLVSGGEWAPGEEVDFAGDGPVAATLSCASQQPWGGALAVLWLPHSGSEVRWEYVEAVPSSGLPPGPQLGRRLAPQQPVFDPQVGAVVRDDALGMLGSPQVAIDVGQVSMVAHGGLMVLMTSDRAGSLGAQLMNYGATAQPVAFPRRQVTSGVQLTRAAWDTAEDLALVSCWAAGGALGSTDPSTFVCARRSLRWFVDVSAAPGLSSVLAFSSAFSLLYLCCCFSRCSRTLREFAASGALGLVPAPQSQRDLHFRRTRMRRLLEMRATLAALPGRYLRTPPGSEGAAIDQDGAENTADSGDEDAMCPSSAAGGREGCCSICHEEVAVRVALRPCGHTACRDCTIRLAETSQRCHICRGPVHGVQPVYL